MKRDHQGSQGSRILRIACPPGQTYFFTNFLYEGTSLTAFSTKTRVIRMSGDFCEQRDRRAGGESVAGDSAVRRGCGVAAVREIEPIEDGGDPARVVRVLTQTDGEVFREVLVALTDAGRSYSYTFLASRVRVRNHLTTLHVSPITDGDRSYVEWFSRFDIDPQYDARLVDLMNRNFLAGLRNLAEKFSRDRPASR